MRLKRVAPLARKLEANMVEEPFAYTEGGLVSSAWHEALF